MSLLTLFVPLIFSLGHAFIISPTPANYRRITIHQLRASPSSKNIPCDGTIATTEEHFSASLLADYWGREPVLMRKAFSVRGGEADHASSWPSWELMMNEIACEEDAEARIIRHSPGDLTSYMLDVGPFDDLSFPEEEEEQEEENKWTLVVNDVDRFHPPLSDWVDRNFAFIPRWRRDDAQVSLAPLGGGIGPHVDSYDVFLIQTSGQREWQVGLDKVSAQDELESSVPGISVRILENWQERQTSIVSLILEPGDVLYLPPRIPHCGTAMTDKCMTLSVGCRAPSATELLARLVEGLPESLTEAAVKRYQDAELLQQQQMMITQSFASSADVEITGTIKDQMKQLVLDAVQEVLEDDDKWDALVGRITTEPKRPRDDYPMSLMETDPEWLEELGVWGNPDKAVKAVRNGEGALFRAEGVSATFSTVKDTSYRLFMNGAMFEVAVVEEEGEALRSLLTAIVSASALTKENLAPLAHQPVVLELLKNLIQQGLLYGSDIEDD